MAHNPIVSFSLRNIGTALGLSLFLFVGSVYADQVGSDYRIGTDVIDAGGVDLSKSNNYLLSDSIGESVVGSGIGTDYQIDSGYRQPSASDFLAMSCGGSVSVGSVVGTGQKTGSGACTVVTDASSGYALGWAVLSGSGGVNTGSLINQYNDVISPYTPSVANVPEAWSLGASSAAWGGRIRSSSTDTALEWGIDLVSEKWLNIRTSNRVVITRSNSTPLSGSTEIFQFRSEVGSSAFKPTGAYRTTVTFTVVGY